MSDRPRFYATVPLVDKHATSLSDEEGHHFLDTEQRWSGRITGHFTARQPLHVGDGALVPPPDLGLPDEAPLVKSFHQAQGKLTIPGASLKGPIRSLIETITYSCVSKTKSRLSDAERECRYDSHRHRGELCPACRIFGAMGYQGSVYFRDAPQTSGATTIHFIPAQYQPKSDENRRHYPHALQDKRDPGWPLQVVTAGSQFLLELDFQNLRPAELGLLLLVLGQGDPPLCLKIGAGKSSGLGAVQFGLDKVERLDVTHLYETYDSTPAWLPVDTQLCLDAAATLLRGGNILARLQNDLGCRSLQ